MFKETLGGWVLPATTRHNTYIKSDHEIYVGNFFSRYRLVAHMKDLGVRVTETTRPNRTVHWRVTRTWNKNHVEFVTTGLTKNMEFSLLTFMTTKLSLTAATTSPLPQLQLCLLSDGAARRGTISVPPPHLTATHNKHMGGVDHLDWLTQNYQIGVRRKNWYFSLFTNSVDTAVENAWIISTIASGVQTFLLDFKRFIVRYCPRMTLLQNLSIQDECRKLPEKWFMMYGLVVQDRLDRTEEGKQRKCAA